VRQFRRRKLIPRDPNAPANAITYLFTERPCSLPVCLTGIFVAVLLFLAFSLVLNGSTNARKTLRSEQSLNQTDYLFIIYQNFVVADRFLSVIVFAHLHSMASKLFISGGTGSAGGQSP
jgi:hypothetical protein